MLLHWHCVFTKTLYAAYTAVLQLLVQLLRHTRQLDPTYIACEKDVDGLRSQAILTVDLHILHPHSHR